MMEDVVGMTALGVMGVLLVSSGPVHDIPSVGSVVGRMADLGRMYDPHFKNIIQFQEKPFTVVV